MCLREEGVPSTVNPAAVVLSSRHFHNVFDYSYDIYVCVCVPEEEREQVERLRWPSRGYLQELSEYQQRRRKLRKSRCIVM